MLSFPQLFRHLAIKFHFEKLARARGLERESRALVPGERCVSGRRVMWCVGCCRLSARSWVPPAPSRFAAPGARHSIPHYYYKKIIFLRRFFKDKNIVLYVTSAAPGRPLHTYYNIEWIIDSLEYYCWLDSIFDQIVFLLLKSRTRLKIIARARESAAAARASVWVYVGGRVAPRWLLIEWDLIAEMLYFCMFNFGNLTRNQNRVFYTNLDVSSIE